MPIALDSYAFTTHPIIANIAWDSQQPGDGKKEDSIDTGHIDPTEESVVSQPPVNHNLRKGFFLMLTKKLLRRGI